MDFGKFVLGFLLSSCLFAHCEVTLRPHEEWWEKNLEAMKPLFAQWFGGCSSPSRIKARQHIRAQHYKTILDIPCSFATDYLGFQQDGIVIEYLGIDIAPTFIKLAQEKNIPAQQGSIEDIPFPDSSFDVCYSRHILEHLSGYEKAIQELVRVARCEVLIVFFIKPTVEPDNFSLSSDHNSLLYFNRYNRRTLEEYVLSNAKAKAVAWEDVNDKEVILHIYLNKCK